MISPARGPRRSLPALLLGLVFVFGPAVSFAVGERPAQIENRRLASFPSLDSGWSFFGKVNTWANDHLPLRDRAVSANTSFSEQAFGETPQYGGQPSAPVGVVAPPTSPPAAGRHYPKVVPGKAGWLFFGGDFSGPCEPKLSQEATLVGLARFARIIQRSGHRFVFTIAPDKSSMNPGKLPDSYLGDDCAPQAKARFWKRLAQRPTPGYVDIKAPLADLQVRSGSNLWRPSDTHWAGRGAAVYVQHVIDGLQPGLWNAQDLHPTGPVHLTGDLSALLGVPKKDTVAGFAVTRPGVTVVRDGETLLAATARPGVPLIRGQSLILGDSFTQASRVQLAQFFQTARIVHPQAAIDDPAGLVQAIKGSGDIVLEIVERSLVAGDVPIIDPAFLDRLDAALR